MIGQTIVIADHDDPDLQSLLSIRSAVHLPLGLGCLEYQLCATNASEWSLTIGPVTLTSESVRNASRVIFRRWRSSPPRAMVDASCLGDALQVDFVERQWDAALGALFQVCYQANSGAWSRNPGEVDYKMVSMMKIGAVVNTPQTRVQQRTPRKLFSRSIWKPIHTDQSFGSGRCSTIESTNDERDQPCPGIYQDLIESVFEIRVGYSFGQVAQVAQYSIQEDSIETIDRRYIPMRRGAVNFRDVENETGNVASILGLNMFTADILVDRADKAWWCDVNPDGLFCAADSDQGDMRRALVRGLVADPAATL